MALGRSSDGATGRSESGLAEAVESGVYGGVSEWTALERQLAKGMPIQEVLNQLMLWETSDGGLFSFPFRIAGLSARLTPTKAIMSTGILTETVAAFDAAQNPIIRTFFSDVLTVSVARRTSGNASADIPWVDRVLYFRCSRSEGNDYLFYSLARYANLRDPKWSKLFSGSPPAYYNMPASYINSAVIRTLASIVEDGEQYRGLLLPLATGLPQLTPSLRDEILRNRFVAVNGSPSEQLAAIMINIMAGHKIHQFSGEAASLVDAHPRAFLGILTAIQKRQLAYHQEREELMDLVRMTHRDRAGAWGLLGKNFERRPSMLLSAGEWERLELPSTMGTVLGLGQ